MSQMISDIGSHRPVLMSRRNGGLRTGAALTGSCRHVSSVAKYRGILRIIPSATARSVAGLGQGMSLTSSTTVAIAKIADGPSVKHSVQLAPDI